MPVGIKADLPVEVPQSMLATLCSKPRYGYQIKFNGEYRTICKYADGSIADFNREGNVGKGLPPALVAALKKHPLPQFVIAGELVGNRTFHLFDALILGDLTLAAEGYGVREVAYHAKFDDFSKLIIPVETARIELAKAELAIQAMEDGCEGIIIRDMQAPYVEGESRQHMKVKFWKTLEAIVMGASSHSKNSVRLGCYDDQGKLHEICGASTLGKKFTPRRGDIVEVKYNKGTRNLHIMEISMQRIRDDKRPEQCLLSQIVVNKDFRQ